MASLTQSAAPYPISNPAPPPRDPHEVINECRRITEGVSELNEQLAALQAAQTRSLNDSNNAPATAELETINTSIMSTYKALIARMKKIKTLPESNSQMNRAQIGLADRSLKDAFQRYKVIESAHQKRIREQIERQYRITRPDASDDEVRAATDDPNAQIFAQALRNSNRRGDGRLVLGAVRERHEAIARIERQMEELAVLFQDMAAAVAQQEPMVQRIEQQAEETHTNVEAGVQHLIPAVKSARAARKKKWICLGLSSKFCTLDLESTGDSVLCISFGLCLTECLHPRSPHTHHHRHRSPHCSQNPQGLLGVIVHWLGCSVGIGGLRQHWFFGGG